MRTTLLALTLALGCGLSAPPAIEAPESKSIELASTYWPPFTADEGEPRVANELVARALSSEGIAAEQVIVADDEWLASLRAGEFDGSAAVWWDPERAQFLLFSDPYLENRLVLVGKAGTDVSATSLAQLSGKRVGIVEGYSYGDELEAVEAVDLVALPSTPASFRALAAGELDYVLVDALFAKYMHATHPRRDEFVVGDAALVTRTLHFAVRKDLPDAEQIIDGFDRRVRQMLREGSFNRILGLDWIEADVDGDGDMELVFAGEHAGAEPPRESYRVTTPRQQSKVEVELQPEYIINGQRYDAWDNVPDSFKVTGVGGTNVGIGIRW